MYYTQSTFGTFISHGLLLLEVCVWLGMCHGSLPVCFVQAVVTASDYAYFPCIHIKFSHFWGFERWGHAKMKWFMAQGPYCLFCPIHCWKLLLYLCCLEDNKLSSEQVSNLWNLHLEWITILTCFFFVSYLGTDLVTYPSQLMQPNFQKYSDTAGKHSVLLLSHS